MVSIVFKQLLGKISAQPHTTLCIQFLDKGKQWQKQYKAIGKTDLFNNSMGLCGNFIQLPPYVRLDYQINERTQLLIKNLLISLTFNFLLDSTVFDK